MKTKKEFRAFVAQEMERTGIVMLSITDEQVQAFANIIYLTGAVDALQDEVKRERAHPRKAK